MSKLGERLEPEELTSQERVAWLRSLKVGDTVGVVSDSWRDTKGPRKHWFCRPCPVTDIDFKGRLTVAETYLGHYGCNSRRGNGPGTYIIPWTPECEELNRRLDGEAAARKIAEDAQRKAQQAELTALLKNVDVTKIGDWSLRILVRDLKEYQRDGAPPAPTVQDIRDLFPNHTVTIRIEKKSA